jgi:two-component system C4-dicarboxylate transport sensor histidine kinase DctB
LINLLSNAIDAVKPCQSRQIRIKVVSSSERITIAVQDSGIGIAADQLDSIFDPFYSHKQDGEGLGLGLSISYNIVQDFGGQIKVSSELGHGSCFTLSLQLAEAT